MSDNLPPCPACGAESEMIQIDGTFGACTNRRCYVAGPRDDLNGSKWRALCRAASGGWTPVSEGLPADGCYDLTLERFGGGRFIQFEVACVDGSWNEYVDARYRVVAYRPTSEPYMGDA